MQPRYFICFNYFYTTSRPVLFAQIDRSPVLHTFGGGLRAYRTGEAGRQLLLEYIDDETIFERYHLGETVRSGLYNIYIYYMIIFTWICFLYP
jgi:hypothetical protein